MAYIVEQQPELLIHSIGPAGSTTFVDSSGKDTPLSVVGSVAYSTSLKKWSQVSVNYPNTSSYLTAGPSSNLVLGTGDFTIDYWIYIPYVDSSGPLHLYNASVGGGKSLYAYQSGTSSYGRFYVSGPSGGTLGSTTSKVNYNSWNHIAIVRKSSVTKLFINGYQYDSKADTSNYTATSWRIGKISCYMEEFRVTKGLAIWDDTFDPPTMPYSVNDGIFTIYADLSMPLGVAIVGIRSIDLYKGDTLLPVVNLSCFDFSGGYTNSGLAFRTDLLKTGPNYENGYLSSSNTDRVVMWSMFEPLDFDKIVINNYHNSGGSTIYGARHIKISASPKVYTENTYYGYGSVDPDATVLVDTDILQHVNSDVEDPQIIYDSGIRSIDGDIVSLIPSVDCFVESESALEDILIDSSFDAVVPSVSGETVNSAYVPFVLLIQSESFDGNKGFYDVANNIPIYSYGNAQHSHTLFGNGVPKFGYTSAWTDIDGGYLETAESDFLKFGTEDFTIDCWFFHVDQWDNYVPYIQFLGSSTENNFPYIWLEASSVFFVRFNGASSGSIGRTQYMQYYRWMHLSWTRRDGVLTYRVNGITLESVADTTNYDTNKIRIGGSSKSVFEEFRVSRYARWSADFTPETSVYSAPFLFVGDVNYESQLNSIAKNMAPDRTTVSCQPWFNQHHFNFSDPSTLGTGSNIGTFSILIEQGRSCIIRNKAYIFGGVLTYKVAGGGDDEFATLGLNSIYVADIDEYGEIGTWSLHPMTCPFLEFQQGQVFTTFNKVYLVGGERWGDPIEYVYYSEINNDGELGPWINGPSLKTGRSEFSIATTRNKIYIFGGRVPSVLGILYTDSCESAYIYPDGSISPWEYEFTLLPTKKHSVIAINTGKKIYLIGEGNTISADVSDEGYVGLTWTDEGWTLPGAYNFVCTNNMLWIFCNTTTRYTTIASDGTIDEPTIDASLLIAPIKSSIFATESKVYSIGGHKDTYVNIGSFYYWTQESLDSILSASFSGTSVGDAEYTQVFESTPLTMGVKYFSPNKIIQSYFGDWLILDTEVNSPLIEISSIVYYLSFIDGDVVSSLPEISSFVFGTSYADIDFVSPIPEVHSYAGRPVISGVYAPLPKISSYTDVSTFSIGRLKSKLPVVESIMSCPIAIWGKVKSIHPHINGSFQTIVEIKSYVPTIQALINNPFAAPINYNTKAPIINSTTFNPEVFNCRIKVRQSKISSNVIMNLIINNQIISNLPSVKSSLQSDINIEVKYNCNVPRIHGEFFVTEDYDLIKYNRNPQCPFN